MLCLTANPIFQGVHSIPLQLQHPPTLRNCNTSKLDRLQQPCLYFVICVGMIQNEKKPILLIFLMQMGSSFKKAIFDEHIQEGLVGWAKQAKKKTVLRKAANGSSPSSQVNHREESPLIQLAKAGSKETATAGEIVHGTSS